MPVERGEADMKAMRACIDVLKDGRALNIFPEGTRTADGELGDFATGTMLLVKRGKPTVVPICIEGAFDIWPRTRKLPRLRGRGDVMVGKPVSYEAIVELPAEEALQRFRDAIVEMQQELREIRKN